MECECLAAYLDRVVHGMNLFIQSKRMDVERNSPAVEHCCVYVWSVMIRFITCISSLNCPIRRQRSMVLLHPSTSPSVSVGG